MIEEKRERFLLEYTYIYSVCSVMYKIQLTYAARPL